jgi:phage terminase large subunit-like protein
MKIKKKLQFWFCLSMYIFFMGFLGCKDNTLAFIQFDEESSEDIYAKNSETTTPETIAPF